MSLNIRNLTYKAINYSMKHLFLLLTIFASLNTAAQTYYPFPKDSAYWDVEEIYWSSFPPGSNGCFTTHYGLAGDTIIGVNTYSKLYGNNLIPGNDTAFNIQTAEYVAAIREDMTKKVWMRRPADTVDLVYYDFALAVGDTFCFDILGTGCHPVGFIDSVLIQGNYRRQIYFQVTNGEVWIEGIGSRTGWFEWQYIGSWSYSLKCYKETQTLIGSDCHCNTYSTGTSNFQSENKAKVYPNPATTEIKIDFNNKSSDRYSIDIYSMLGEKLKMIRSDQSTILLNINDLSEGVYFIVIMDENGRQWTEKIIKSTR
jgi:hypothetical protein